MIALRANNYLEVYGHDRKNEPLVEHRYSAHVSPNSTGHTLTGHYVLESGPHLKMAAFVACDGKPLVAHLFSRRWPILTHPHFRLRARGNDITHRIASFNQLENNLITHVFVCSSGLAQEVSKEIGGVYHRFNYFDVVVAVNFMMYPPLLVGDTLHIQTSDPTLRDSDPTQQFGAIPTLKPHEVAREVEKMNERLVGRIRQRIGELAVNGDPLAIAMLSRGTVVALDTEPFGYHFKS